MKPLGGSVAESVELFERQSGVKREVDILAEVPAYGSHVRIAVEVRSRSRTDDVRWIDELEGKYRDLDVDKVVAVSASGFSEAARKKALAVNIQILTASGGERAWLASRVPEAWCGNGCSARSRAPCIARD